MVAPFRRRACQVQERLSKNSFLALVGPPPEISGTDQETFSSNPTRAFFEKIDIDSWTIISFDAFKRVVCVEITTDIGTRTISVNIPIPSVSGLKD